MILTLMTIVIRPSLPSLWDREMFYGRDELQSNLTRTHMIKAHQKNSRVEVCSPHVTSHG